MFEQLHIFMPVFHSASRTVLMLFRILPICISKGKYPQLMILVAATSGLSACGLLNVHPQSTGPSTTIVMPVQTPAQISRQQRIERLLERADRALKAGRLTSPESDNAYDRYRAVSMIAPDNSDAKHGLRRILLVYVARAHQAASSGQVWKAKQIVKQMEEHFSGDPLILVMKTRLEDESKNRVSAEPEPSVEVRDEQKLLLPTQALSGKDDSIKSILNQVVQRIQASDEGVIIHARTDAEGRWIYQTMKQAAQGYRIRGDIRVNRKPAIVFINPF